MVVVDDGLFARWFGDMADILIPPPRPPIVRSPFDTAVDPSPTLGDGDRVFLALPVVPTKTLNESATSPPAPAPAPDPVVGPMVVLLLTGEATCAANLVVGEAAGEFNVDVCFCSACLRNRKLL